jgi:hypothetical protein
VFDGQLEFSTHAGSTYSVAFWTVQPTLCMALFQHANVKDALQRVRKIMLRESFRTGLPIAENLAVAGNADAELASSIPEKCSSGDSDGKFAITLNTAEHGFKKRVSSTLLRPSVRASNAERLLWRSLTQAEVIGRAASR